MTNKLLTSVAAGALFLGAAIAPVAFAQDTTQPSTTQTMEDPAATPEAGSTDMGATPSDDAAATDTTTETAPMRPRQRIRLKRPLPMPTSRWIRLPLLATPT